MNDSRNIATQMMTFYQETASKRGGGGWRAVGQKIGCSGAYARQLAMGTKPITPEIAGDWLVATGWQVKRHEVDACPDCGDVHTGRCNGKPVAAVVTLAPGETARITNGTKRKRKRKKDWAVRLPLDLRAECEAQGVKPTSAIVAHAMRDYLALQRLYRRREDDEAALVEATARRQSDGG